MSIDVCIGNYGYYNEGELRDAWISLPKTSEEISDFLSAHGLQDPEHEEIYISDYDGVPFGLTGLFSEFTWLEDLNMLARQMEEREGAVEKVQGALDCGIDGPEMRFITSVAGRLQIYTYDCADLAPAGPDAKIIEGRYGVYAQDGTVFFEKWS